MSAEKKRRLEKTVAALQAQWGIRAIRRLQPQARAAIPYVTTGFPSLDKSLNIGGIPRGRITEFIGVPTSGMATLALKITANVQAKGETVVYLDLERTFDPEYAARCGVILEQLILVHPYDGHQAMVILRDFVSGGGPGVLVCDLPLPLLQNPRLTQAFSSNLERILAPLAKSPCALLCLVSLPAGTAVDAASASLAIYPLNLNLPHYATVRLLLQRERWLYRRHDISGYQAQVLVLKNKLGRAGQMVHVDIDFNGMGSAGNQAEGGT